MKSITLITREYPPVHLGGIGNTARFLSNALVSAKFKTKVITPKFKQYSNLPSYEEKGQVDIYRLYMRYRVFFWYKASLFTWMNRKLMKESSLIHLFNARDAPFLYKKKDCPLIANINDYYMTLVPLNPLKYPFNEKGKFTKTCYYNWFKLLDYTSLQRADLIISNTKYNYEAIKKPYRLKRKNYRVVYKGIDIKEFDDHMPVKKIWDFLFVGSPMEPKGSQEFLKAVKILIKKHKDIKCAMIGRPSEIGIDYDHLIEKMGLGKNVRYLGFLPHDRLIQEYHRSKIYVLPTHREALGQTLLEAMAAKLPIIATDVGGIPEIITKKNSFMVEAKKVKPLVEKMDILLENPKVCKEMGIVGYERVKKNFSFKDMIDAYMDIYEEYL
ncbi:glycosyltransferase family 4 protein [Candidatus Woesearchaeota archaeon]|nr:glycosyltransferase family 4 protein [Candidatus Woesearchaeota archaeon]